jgi:hypothetical protein
MTGNSPAVAPQPGLDARQIIKLVVYTLLLINFGLYIADDISIAAHTLRNGGGFFDYTAAFAVSIGVLAWLMLLFLFELETYLLSDDAFTPVRVAMMHGLRLTCYVFLAYQLLAYSQAGFDLIDVQAVPGVDTLCQLAGRDVSFGFNITYTDLTPENCAGLSADTRFFLIENGTVVTDTLGLQIERELVWIDLAEAIVWLVIVLCIEIVVRLQDRGITRGAAIRSANVVKFLLYMSLWCMAAYWIYRGHYRYAYDEALWIFGFFAIEGNISEWKRDIRSGAS